MSSRKKPTITEKRIAASQANGRRSRGPATPEGRERICAANTRHGFYSQAERVVSRALGEKPDEFDFVVKAPKGPSPYERAAEIAPTHPNARLMRRMQDSNFREVWRITNLLLKIKRQAREEEDLENPSRPLNVNENTAA